MLIIYTTNTRLYSTIIFLNLTFIYKLIFIYRFLLIYFYDQLKLLISEVEYTLIYNNYYNTHIHFKNKLILYFYRYNLTIY